MIETHLGSCHCAAIHLKPTEIGGDYVSVQLAALDNADPVELIEPPIWFADGRNNNWSMAPTETRHL